MIRVTLSARPPFAGEALLAFLGGRAIAGVERVDLARGAYVRFVRLGEARGFVEVTLDPERPGILAEIDDALAPEAPTITRLLARVFDLDAPSDEIDAALARDPLLAPSVARLPGLRVAGAFAPFEIAVRTILGQQISVPAASGLCSRLVAKLGDRVPLADGTVAHVFPTPDVVAALSVDDVASLGMPGKRAQTILGLAARVASGELVLAHGEDAARAVATMRTIPGIGPWTADYIAMRVFGDPDRFLADDLVVKKVLGVMRARDAEARAEAFRPYRAYATMHLFRMHGPSGGG